MVNLGKLSKQCAELGHEGTFSEALDMALTAGVSREQLDKAWEKKAPDWKVVVKCLINSYNMF